MVIEHNMAALAAGNEYRISTDKRIKSTEKLSSGYRINKSADDVAGLSISEKMRWQIRGLNKASNNIQDGISVCQIADGALNESQMILQRMRELSVQSANDTNTSGDRSAIQSEINQLKQEIDRVATHTCYNSQVYPLSASSNNQSTSITYNPNDLISGTESFVKGEAYGIVQSNIGDYSVNYGDAVNSRKIMNGLNDLHMEYKAQYIVCTWRCDDTKAYLDIRQTDKNGNEMWACINNNTVPEKELTVAQGKTIIMSNGEYKLDFGDKWGYITVGRTKGADIPDGLNKNGVMRGYFNSPKTGKIIPNDKYISARDNGNIWIQVGALEKQGINIELVDATSNGLGISNIDVRDNKSAGNAITMIDGAINKSSHFRSKFGVQQNRLEHAMKVDDNISENTQSSESKIRDVDMATEMVEYSKQNILAQVGMSMMAQANSSKEGILNLLQ